MQGYHERATFNNEDAVKRVVRRILDYYKVFHFMPPANSYGKSGISDILALSNGRFIAIECKYKYNKPTAQQLEYGKSVEEGGGLFVVVNEKNLPLILMRVLHFINTGIDPEDNDQL